MSVQAWEHYFKPEVRNRGRSLLTQGKVTLSQPSDTEVFSFIRATTPFKVTLKVESVESHTIYADCNCPLSKKGQFCKHIWATLLITDEKKADFLESKTELHKLSSDNTTSISKSKKSQVQSDSQDAYKAKQNDYRKEQYQKQKQRLKDIKKSKKNAHEPESFPPFVETALKYFSENGFELRETMNTEAINLAKKKLSRVFHPDVGGTHSEILELNDYTDTLLKFAKD